MLQECKEKFSNAKLRKKHCIEAHKFPSDFRFGETWKPPDILSKKAVPKKRGNRSDKMEIDSNPNIAGSDGSASNSNKMEVVQSKCSEPKRRYGTVPKEFSFGMGVPKAFVPERKSKKTEKQWHQALKQDNQDTATNIEDVEFSDLKEALPKND